MSEANVNQLIAEMLILSSSLSSLTYTIGTLLIGLPIPIGSLKRWGIKLINDGIYANIWVNLYGALSSISIDIQNWLGASWSNYFNWLNNMLVTEVDLYLLVKSAYLMAVASLDPALQSLLSPLSFISSVISGIISLTATLMVISNVIYNYVPLFAALGILLLSLPFRVGRGIGGSLIAFSIIFWSALPYLPNFLDIFGVNLLNLASEASKAPDLVQWFLTQGLPGLIEGTLVFPIAYLTLLSALTIGLGSAISGYSARMPIPIEIF